MVARNKAAGNQTVLGFTAQSKRLHEGLTVREAADQAGVTATSYFRIEKGFYPNIVNFKRVIAWLGKDAEEMMEDV